ncbi:MAG: SH3 domain-containing protein [Saprospiraceae bacterium]
MKQKAAGSWRLLALPAHCLFFFGWQQTNWLNSRKEAIIFQPSITVTSTPDKTGEELFVLHEGTKVRIVERFRDWIRVRIGDGNTGWVPEKVAKEI